MKDLRRPRKTQQQCQAVQCDDACEPGCGASDGRKKLRGIGTHALTSLPDTGLRSSNQRPRDPLAALAATVADNEPRPRTNGPREPVGIENPGAPALVEAAAPPPPPPQLAVAAPPAARVVPPPTGGAAVEAARPALRFSPRTFGRRLKAASFCSNPDDGTQCAIDPRSCAFATSPHYTPKGAAFEEAVKTQLRMDIVRNVHAIADEVFACVRNGRHADLGLLDRFVGSTVLCGPGPAALAAHAPHPLSPAAAHEASIEAHDFAPKLAALALLDTDFDIYHGATDPGDAPAPVLAPWEVDEDAWSERRRLLEAALLRKREIADKQRNTWEKKRDEGTASLGGGYCDASGKAVERGVCPMGCAPTAGLVACGGRLCNASGTAVKRNYCPMGCPATDGHPACGTSLCEASGRLVRREYCTERCEATGSRPACGAGLCDASGTLVQRSVCTARCEATDTRVACGGALCTGEDGRNRRRTWCRCEDERCGGGFCDRSHKRRGDCMCGDLRCGFNKPRQIMSRMINKAFAPNLTNDQIDVGLGYTAKQLREALLKTSPWDEATTIDKWNRGELQVDHIIPLAHFRDRGAFVDANGMPTPLAFEANALWNLQLLEAAVNREKSDSYTATCAAGLARRKACFVAARGGTESFDFERYLELLVADVRAGNHSIGAPAKEP